MLQPLKELLNSKKFWMVVIGSGVVSGLHYAGAPLELVAIIGSFFGLNITAQGMADFKKNQPR